MQEAYESFVQLTAYELWGNSVLSWLIGFGISAGMFVAALMAQRIAVRRIHAWSARTTTKLDDLMARIVERTSTLFLLVGSLYIGSLALALPEPAERVRRVVFVIAAAVQIAIWGHQLVGYGIEVFIRRRQGAAAEPDPAMVAGMGIARFILMVLMYAVVVLFAADNLGIDITAMIAGLGIGGIAIALAVQSILGDLFASLSIVLDKPFMVGDFIIVGDKMGTVEKIGIKTTRVRALSGEQLIFANSDLLASRIQNFRRMNERRVTFTVGVVYQTPLEKIKLIPQIITSAVKAQPRTRFDRSHFRGFGPSSLDFETVYFVADRDFNIYMDIQQAINLELVRRFEDENIAFAYPTQTVILSNNKVELSPAHSS